MYKINGQAFVIQPSVAKWIEPSVLDIDGNGHPIYPAVTNFEMEWQNLNPSGTFQLYEFFRALHITGSAVVELPQFGANSYTFYAYTGCVVYLPRFGNFFVGQTLDVRLTISKIRYDTFS